MFENGLRPQFRKFVVSQRFHTLEVVDYARALELESAATQRNKELAPKSVEEKVKGKRPFTSLGQGRPYPRGPSRSIISTNCYNCGQLGHLVRECGKLKGPGRQG